MSYEHHPRSTGHYPIKAMFGSQNTYGGYNNSYGQNAPYYPPASNPDSFWGKQQSQNRVNYRNQDEAIANDSLYGYQNNNSYPEQSVDGSIESGLSGLSIDARQSDDFGPPSFASIGSQKSTSWASIASQPAKSQPKSLKSKMAASGLTGSTSKHLPPTVTMDAMSRGSKSNGVVANPAMGGKSPAASGAPSGPPASASNRAASPIEELPSPGIQQSQQATPPLRPLNHTNKENSWTGNGNSSSSGSISTSASSPRPSQPPLNLPKINNNGNMRGPMNEINENYNPNKYSNQRNQHHYQQPPPHHNNNNSYHNAKPLLDNPPYSSRNSGPASAAAGAVVRDVPPVSPALTGNICQDMSRADLEKLFDENDYNPKEFDLSPRNARFFIIKSYSEDDVHRSIKYSIWCSTDHGNKRLDTAFRQQEGKGPIYLLYSVNRSGHFCGVAQMMSPVDYNASAGVWAQDKWKGQFQVKWIYVKDVPNDELRHITLENNENKPVTNSRDTQEVPYEKGKKVLTIIHNFDHRTSIFDDFLHYEKKQEEEQRKPDLPPSPPPVNNYTKMSNSQYSNSGQMPPRDNQMPYRGSGSNNFGKQNRSYTDQARDHRDHRNEYRNDYRGDHRGNEYRAERNDYRNERPQGEFSRGERNMEHRGGEYRDNREGPREYREYREGHREPQFHRDQYQRDFHQQPPRDGYARERNDYPRSQEHREFRGENRERVSNERSQQQSWRN